MSGPGFPTCVQNLSSSKLTYSINGLSVVHILFVFRHHIHRMLDIKFIRENSDLVKKAAEQKHVTVDIDRLLVLDGERREFQGELDEVNRQRNEAAKAKDAERGKALKGELAEIQEKLRPVEVEYLELMQSVPNIPSEDTPVEKDESENVVIRKFLEPTKFNFEPKSHDVLGKALGVIDNETAANVSGARFTYLKGGLALMQFALVQLVFETLTNEETLKAIIEKAGLSISAKPFVPVVPPVFIRPEIMQQMGRLEPRDERYYIPSDDLFLIGSAEHTLGPMHMNQTIPEADLPLRYIGYSTAFRREAGSYGKDTKGIFRVHQFDKLEMESFSNPDSSIEEQNLFIAVQEHLVQQLNIPYEVMQICTGDMGKPDSRQVDINMWMPGQDAYRETHTSDLMTDFQSRRLNIKTKGESGKRFVHMNDATAIAIGRTLVAIMENYQQADGTILVPDVLQKWMNISVIK